MARRRPQDWLGGGGRGAIGRVVGGGGGGGASRESCGRRGGAPAKRRALPTLSALRRGLVHSARGLVRRIQLVVRWAVRPPRAARESGFDASGAAVDDCRCRTAPHRNDDRARGSCKPGAATNHRDSSQRLPRSPPTTRHEPPLHRRPILLASRHGHHADAQEWRELVAGHPCRDARRHKGEQRAWWNAVGRGSPTLISSTEPRELARRHAAHHLAPHHTTPRPISPHPATPRHTPRRRSSGPSQADYGHDTGATGSAGKATNERGWPGSLPVDY